MKRLLLVASCILCASGVLAELRLAPFQFKKEAGANRAEKDKLEGKLPPDLKVSGWMNIDGREMKLGDLKGKVVVLDFWGVWCPPCRAAVPKLKKLYEKYKGDGLVIIGVHTTNQGEKMAEFVKKEGITWPVCVDADKGTVGAFLVDSYPDYYLIDHTGILRVADLANADLENAVEILMKEKAAAAPK